MVKQKKVLLYNTNFLKHQKGDRLGGLLHARLYVMQSGFHNQRVQGSADGDGKVPYKLLRVSY